MKKLLFTAACLICIIMLASCDNSLPFFAQPTPSPVPRLNASEILTADTVIAYAGFEPVLDGGAATEDGNKTSALYRTEPVGQADTVEITIMQYDESTSIEDVWNSYAEDKAARTTAEEITELGENAYIAFPSINIYDRGCYIKITAGSGSDDAQRNLLIYLAREAVAKFESIWPAPAVEQ